MEESKQKLRRLVVDVPLDLHVEIKIRATKRGITLRKYILRAIMDVIKREKEYE